MGASTAMLLPTRPARIEPPAIGGQSVRPAAGSVDTLTGLPDRAWLRGPLGGGGSARSALLVDLDDFKDINDALGPARADLLLCLVAERLRGCLRDDEPLVRWGGDEFAVLSPRSGDAAERLAAALVLALSSHFLLAGEPFYLSCTIGIATRAEACGDLELLLTQADIALAEAQRCGRGTWLRYSAELSERLTEKVALSQALHAATPEREFELHYQPQVDLVSGAVVGAEALLRWRHPRQGLLMPGRFVAFAEQTGRIIPIGHWVLGEAARMAAAWNRGAAQPVKVAVNVSPRQFAERALPGMVEQALRRTGCQPEWLELEITESMLLSDGGPALCAMEAVSSLGVSIAIDDFCTGHSSLSYLTRFPVDVLKLDRSFVSGMEFDPRRAALVQALLSMAQALGLQAIAEGIENGRQAAMLRQLGCPLGQGLHFGGPVPAAAFARPH